jgi:hypothetical protein
MLARFYHQKVDVCKAGTKLPASLLRCQIKRIAFVSHIKIVMPFDRHNGSQFQGPALQRFRANYAFLFTDGTLRSFWDRKVSPLHIRASSL